VPPCRGGMSHGRAETSRRGNGERPPRRQTANSRTNSPCRSRRYQAANETVRFDRGTERGDERGVGIRHIGLDPDRADRRLFPRAAQRCCLGVRFCPFPGGSGLGFGNPTNRLEAGEAAYGRLWGEAINERDPAVHSRRHRPVLRPPAMAGEPVGYGRVRHRRWSIYCDSAVPAIVASGCRAPDGAKEGTYLWKTCRET
jgi:hypothetical protein